MLITGDIASPRVDVTNALACLLRENQSIFQGETIICNFEGLLNSEIIPTQNKPVLFNHPFILDVLTADNQLVCCLANNHVQDLPQNFNYTIDYFKSRGILYTGAGNDHLSAEEPVKLNDKGRNVLLFNACWDFLLYKHGNPKNGIYVAEINEISLLKKVETAKFESNDSIIIVYLHWNLDYEKLPFPAHREFARALIDSGANVVVGSHAHCVHGGEIYRDGYIVYGLGNFYIPHECFIDGKLTYPDHSKTQLVVEWSSRDNNMLCHWFEYDYKNSMHFLRHVSSEPFNQSTLLNNYTPYKDLTTELYIKYYKTNRLKRILIPVYRDYRNTKLNRLMTTFLKARAHVAHSLARMNFIKW